MLNYIAIKPFLLRIKPMKHIFNSIALIIFGSGIIFLSGCSLWSVKSSTSNIQAVKINPEAESLVSRAKEYWQGKETCANPKKALEYLDTALKIDPSYAPAKFWRGLTLSYAGYHEEALDDLTAVIRQNPMPENYTYRGLVMFRLGNYQGAIQDFNKALSLDKNFSKALIFRAGTYLKQGDIPKACEDFVAACEQNDCTGLNLAKQEGVCK